MPSYTLTEFKLRRYFYLGHEYSVYVPPAMRKSVNKKHRYDDAAGVRIIGKIIRRNKAEEINSIVPIILKMKKENTLHDDRCLIFALAVCARFNLKQCSKMVADAYAAVSELCTDGLKLLMFAKFCQDVNIILHDEGYLPNLSSGFGNGFRKAMNKWYLSKDPLLTTEQIVKYKCYDGLSHKNIMESIHIKSDDPSRQVFITHTKNGMKRVEELFESKLYDIQTENESLTLENIEFTFVYNYLKQVNDMRKMDVKTLRNDIELNRWGHDYQLVPKNMLKYYTILIPLITHMPLRALLDNTLNFAKHKLFTNPSPNIGLWEFILRFNNTLELKKHQIHPIESYIEYVKYSRNFKTILQRQNSYLKKQGHYKIEPFKDKLKLCFKLKSFSDDELNFQTINKTFKNEICTTQSTVENVSILFQTSPSNSNINYTQQNLNGEHSNPTGSSVKNEVSVSKLESKLEKQKTVKSRKNYQHFKKVQKLTEPTVQVQSEMNAIGQSQLNYLYFMKPPPKLDKKLLQFLSEDLLNKTLQILKPTFQRIIIVYDNRKYMENYMCANTRLLSVSEAVTLIILSLFKPEKWYNKPTICYLNDTLKTCKITIKKKQALTVANLQPILFAKPSDGCISDSDKKDITNINFLSVMNRAKKCKEEYDVFVFLGTNKMDFAGIKQSINKYQSFLEKPVRIITCCLNGKHSAQSNLSRGNMLFINGFDKNVGKIMRSFINNEF